MPRQSKNCIVCAFYMWNLLDRGGVAYADGRSNTPNLGKQSLGVRSQDKDAVIAALRELDRQMAINNGLALNDSKDSHGATSMPDGWAFYMTFCERPAVLGGAGVSTIKRYRAVRDKHQQYCMTKVVPSWTVIDKKAAEQDARWLSRKG